MPTQLAVCCMVCEVEPPREVVEALTEQLVEVGPGGVLEKAGWLGRVGPGRWGSVTLYACPDHRVASGLLS
jgi:hypothetical protein